MENNLTKKSGENLPFQHAPGSSGSTHHHIMWKLGQKVADRKKGFEPANKPCLNALHNTCNQTSTQNDALIYVMQKKTPEGDAWGKQFSGPVAAGRRRTGLNLMAVWHSSEPVKDCYTTTLWVTNGLQNGQSWGIVQRLFTDLGPEDYMSPWILILKNQPALMFSCKRDRASFSRQCDMR